MLNSARLQTIVLSCVSYGETRKIKVLFILRDRNSRRSHVVYSEKCSSGESYIAETMRNFEIRETEYENPNHNSQSVCHLKNSTYSRGTIWL